MPTKKCINCKIEKELDEFYPDKKYRDGHISRCRTCFGIRDKELRETPHQQRPRTITQELKARGLKHCPDCNTTKPLSEFGKNASRRSDGFQGLCRDCSRTRSAQFSKSEHGQRAHRRKHLQRTFGLTIDAYDYMAAKQNDCCAICGKPETAQMFGKTLKLAVDHDHATGEIRQLLCSRCNIGLGAFDDNTTLLTAAITYLARHTAPVQGQTEVENP